MKHSNLEVVQGDSVTLPCSFFTMSPLSRLNIIWTRAPFSDPDFPTQVWFVSLLVDTGDSVETFCLARQKGLSMPICLSPRPSGDSV